MCFATTYVAWVCVRVYVCMCVCINGLHYIDKYGYELCVFFSSSLRLTFHLFSYTNFNVQIVEVYSNRANQSWKKWAGQNCYNINHINKQNLHDINHVYIQNTSSSVYPFHFVPIIISYFLFVLFYFFLFVCFISWDIHNSQLHTYIYYIVYRDREKFSLFLLHLTNLTTWLVSFFV